MKTATQMSAGLRLSLLVAISALVLIGAVATATAIGDYSIPVRTVFLTVTNHFGLTSADVPKIEASVVWNLRLSRSSLPPCAGRGWRSAGAILQALLAQSLAEPFVLGVSAGASTGAVAVLVLGIGAGAVSLSLGAFVGAFGAFALVAVLSNGATSGPNHTFLAGVAASSAFQCVDGLYRHDIGQRAAGPQRHVSGCSAVSAACAGRNSICWLLSFVVSLAICIVMARALDAFTFGDEDAAALGIPVARTRLILFGVTALMTATIVSQVGAIGFVGLVVPACRTLCRRPPAYAASAGVRQFLAPSSWWSPILPRACWSHSRQFRSVLSPRWSACRSSPLFSTARGRNHERRCRQAGHGA